MDLNGSFGRAFGIGNHYGFKLIVGQTFRLIYGNDAGFLNNIIPRMELKKIQNQKNEICSIKDVRSNLLIKEGYLPINPSYDSELIAEIGRKYEILIKNDSYSKFIGPRVKEAIRGIADPLKNIPELRHLLTSEVKQIIQDYYKTNFKILHVRCWRNYHVNNDGAKQDVYSNLWHNDPHPVTLLRFFVYLTDGVNSQTGALHLHSIRETKKIIRSGYMRRKADIGRAQQMINDKRRVIAFEGDRGSACFLQLCLHKAGIPSINGYRDMIQFTIAPAQFELDENWHTMLPLDKENLPY